MDAILHIGLKAFIRKGDDILILADVAGGLDIPGGKLQESETDPIAALKREVREETGLEIEVERPFTTWVGYFPEHHRFYGKKVFLVGYLCRYVSGDVAISDEHRSFRWVNKENYPAVAEDSHYFTALTQYFS